MEPVKCVVVGDGAVGKTCMLMSYTRNQFPKEYVPTVFENYQATVQVDEEPTSLSLFDTAGQESYDRLRPLSYDMTDVFLICFAVNDVTSFKNVENKWIKEISHFAPGVPFLLVGTKSDMRSEQKELLPASSAEQMSDVKNDSKDLASAIPTEQKPEPVDMVLGSSAEQMKERLKAAGYFECSAMEQEGLRIVFNEAIRAVRTARKKRSRFPDFCRIL